MCCATSNGETLLVEGLQTRGFNGCNIAVIETITGKKQRRGTGTLISTKKSEEDSEGKMFLREERSFESGNRKLKIYMQKVEENAT